MARNITSRTEDYSQWYLDIIKVAELAGAETQRGEVKRFAAQVFHPAKMDKEALGVFIHSCILPLGYLE